MWCYIQIKTHLPHLGSLQFHHTFESHVCKIEKSFHFAACIWKACLFHNYHIAILVGPLCQLDWKVQKSVFVDVKYMDNRKITTIATFEPQVKFQTFLTTYRSSKGKGNDRNVKEIFYTSFAIVQPLTVTVNSEIKCCSS